MKRYVYTAETQAGTKLDFDVEAHDESIANAEAMHEVKKWLDSEGEAPENLTRFDLLWTTPI